MISQERSSLHRCQISMNGSQAITQLSIPDSDNSSQANYIRACHPLQSTCSTPSLRSRRIVLLLLLIWTVGIADHILTVTAHGIGNFAESNPIASFLVHDTRLLAVFKIASMVFASSIFAKFRRHWFTEAACWAMCAIHVALAFIWLSYIGQIG